MSARAFGWCRVGPSVLVAALAGCADDGDPLPPLQHAVPAEGIAADSEAPEASPSRDPATVASPGGPTLGAIHMMVSVYAEPDHRCERIGYLRVGTRATRAEKPAAFDSCQHGFYAVLPQGYVCIDDGATTDMEHPLMRADLTPADRTRPLPYDYAFIRAIAPRYYRLPTPKEQFKYEMSLKRHLRSFKRLKTTWNRIDVGSNDVRMLPDGVVLGPPPGQPPDLTTFEKFGGDPEGEVPWFFDGGRQIPNVSSFKVPDYAVITNRIKRHAGVALIDAFPGEERDFALTTDLRLIPISKLKPGRGSTFHGVELTEGWELPVGFVKRDGVYAYDKRKGSFRRIKKKIAYGAPIQLTGEVRRDGSRRYVETETGVWMRSRDLAIAPLNSKLPRTPKAKDEKWVDVSIQRQTLTLYEGREAVFVTMVSTGKDGLGGPGKSHSTPRGTFRIRDKHVTTTMDSSVVGEEFELMDVPWVQYFKAGYALHAAYWHTEYGRPRSHGCINLSPLDAYRVFHWTEPSVPEPWHSVSAGDLTGAGTLVHVRP
ncbi:MAG: L,D-transpeptidase [Myxococcota bacterium]